MSAFRVAPLETSLLESARTVIAEAYTFQPGAAIVAKEKVFGPSVVWDSERLVGPKRDPGAQADPLAGWAAGAWEEDILVGIAAGAGGFLRMLAVRPGTQKRGAGTALLNHAIERARLASALTLRAGDQPGNYLTPGVDERDTGTIAWLERRGFARIGVNRNFVVALNERDWPADAAAQAEKVAAKGYEVKKWEDRHGALLAFVGKHFSQPWAIEVERGEAWMAVKKDDGAIAAFAAHDGNNAGLGWFGPAGTLLEHRRKGLGHALLAASLAEIRAQRHTHAEIAWAGAEDFYTHILGPLNERRFVTLEKTL